MRRLTLLTFLRLISISYTPPTSAKQEIRELHGELHSTIKHFRVPTATSSVSNRWCLGSCVRTSQRTRRWTYEQLIFVMYFKCAQFFFLKQRKLLQIWTIRISIQYIMSFATEDCVIEQQTTMFYHRAHKNAASVCQILGCEGLKGSKIQIPLNNLTFTTVRYNVYYAEKSFKF